MQGQLSAFGRKTPRFGRHAQIQIGSIGRLFETKRMDNLRSDLEPQISAPNLGCIVQCRRDIDCSGTFTRLRTNRQPGRLGRFFYTPRQRSFDRKAFRIVARSDFYRRRVDSVIRCLQAELRSRSFGRFVLARHANRPRRKKRNQQKIQQFFLHIRYWL